jgi:hypothetical protein
VISVCPYMKVLKCDGFEQLRMKNDAKFCNSNFSGFREFFRLNTENGEVRMEESWSKSILKWFELFFFWTENGSNYKLSIVCFLVSNYIICIFEILEGA